MSVPLNHRQNFDKEIIGENLRELRNHSNLKKLSNRSIAVLLKMAPTTVSNHLNGKTLPNPDEISRWAKLLKVGTDRITSPRESNSSSMNWHTILRKVVSCRDEKEFEEFLYNDSKLLPRVAAFDVIRRAIMAGQDVGHIQLGWSEDRTLAARIRRSFGLEGVEVQAVDTITNDSSHLFDAAADAIWSHAIRLFEVRKDTKGDNGKLVVIKGAIGSGRTVAEIMKRVIERVARMCWSPRSPGGIPLTFDFHPMASSIHTQRPADNIPSVFLHSAIDKYDLSNLKERVYPTPDQMYQPKNASAWFFDQIDFVVTSIASTADEHSMLIQHLRQLRFPVGESVGEVQFRPFSANEFIQPTDRRLPKTLIPIQKLQEFSAFVPMGRPRPLVTMVAGPCGLCQRLKGDALHPMLVNSVLRIFNHLIIDRETASSVLEFVK